MFPFSVMLLFIWMIGSDKFETHRRSVFEIELFGFVMHIASSQLFL